MSPMALVTRPLLSTVRAASVMSAWTWASWSSVAARSSGRSAASRFSDTVSPFAGTQCFGLFAGAHHGVPVAVHRDGAAGHKVGVLRLAVFIRFQLLTSSGVLPVR